MGLVYAESSSDRASNWWDMQYMSFLLAMSVKRDVLIPCAAPRSVDSITEREALIRMVSREMVREDMGRRKERKGAHPQALQMKIYVCW